jgi:hypothetical protein
MKWIHTIIHQSTKGLQRNTYLRNKFKIKPKVGPIQPKVNSRAFIKLIQKKLLYFINS